MKKNKAIRLARIFQLSGNIGDYAQTIGLEQVYKKCGLEPDIDSCGIAPLLRMKQCGDEHVIVPYAALSTVNTPFIEPMGLPSHVTPVFLGIAFTDMLALDHFKELISGTQGLPILCRDQISADLLKKAGFNGEFWGCASLLIPRREKEPENGKIYACDLNISPVIMDYIPEDIKNEMIELESQELPPDYVKSLEPEELVKVQYKKMREKLDLLRDTARLVITARLHVALPCIAMGIPVIKVSYQREQRLSLIDSHYRAYRASEFAEIDWNPPAPDIEEAKRRMLDVACDVLQAAYARVEGNNLLKRQVADLRKTCFKKLTKHYSMTYYRGYAGLPPNIAADNLKDNKFFKRITGKYPKDTDLVFYGAGINGMHLLQSMKNLVDVCKSFSFIDGSPARCGSTYGGYPVKSPDSLREYDRENLVIFVTPFGCCGGAAEAIAEKLENDFGLCESIHFYLYEIIMYSMIQECFGMPCITSAQFRNDRSLGAWEFRYADFKSDFRR